MRRKQKLNIMAYLAVLRQMSSLGYSELTHIQQLIIEPLLQGKSIIVQAPHDTGKMTMICLAISENIDVNIKACQTIIFTASLEEATKVHGRLINSLIKDSKIPYSISILHEGCNFEEVSNSQIIITTNSTEILINVNDERLSNLRTVVFKTTKNGSHLRNMKKFASKCLNKTKDAPKIQTIVSTLNFLNVPANFQLRVIKWQLEEDVKPNTTNPLILALGFNVPLPIQQLVFDTFVHGKSLIVQGPAGSGKTTAICVSLVQQLKPLIKGCQAVIVTNTQESVAHIERLLLQLSVNSNGSNEHKIMVGTALTVKKIMSKKEFSKTNVKTIFFDSADDLLVPRSSIDYFLQHSKQFKQTIISTISMSNLSTYRHIPIVELPSDDYPTTNFADMHIFKELLKGITDMAFTQPLPIQQVSIVPCMQGQSMILQAPASSGKTTAICISALQRIDLTVTRCQVLIITSCQESANKIYSLIQRLSVNFPCETFLCKDNDQKHRKFGNHIVIGTVVQLEELLQQNVTAMSHLRILVLDAADDIEQLCAAELKHLLKLVGTVKQILLTTIKMENLSDFYHLPIVNLPILKHRRRPRPDHTKNKVTSKSLKPNQNGARSTETPESRPVLKVAQNLPENMISIFADLKLSDKLLRGILESGYETSTEVQKRSLLPCVQGQSMIILAPPGAGKRVIFCIAMLQSVNEQVQHCQVLIIAQTHEAALKIEEILRKLGAHLNVSIHACIGGEDRRKDRTALQNGCQIVVGTFGRLNDLLGTKWLTLKYAKAFVLDDSHKLSDDSNALLQAILQQLPVHAQRIFTSTGNNTNYIYDYFSTYLVVDKREIELEQMKQINAKTGKPYSFEVALQIVELKKMLQVTEVVLSREMSSSKDEEKWNKTEFKDDTLRKARLHLSTNCSLYVASGEINAKLLVLLNLFSNNQLLIWCSSTSEVSKLAKFLTKQNEKFVSLTENNDSKSSRKLMEFRNRHTRILIVKYGVVVGQDLTIDVPVAVIINYQLPISADDYGKKMESLVPNGVVISFVKKGTKANLNKLKSILK